MAGFPEACVEQPLASGSLPGRAVEAGFPKAAPGSDLATNRGRTVSRAGAPAQDDTFGDATGALTTPVQILSKPCPRYPEEALGRGLQGDVLLDVEFRYSGAVEVLGVRRGLGHGLNESAIEAARKMRFVPARRDGRPVDTQATLRIRFQLLQ
jgi:TonB family protein